MSKAYHKANSERTNYMMELSTTKGAYNGLRSSQKIGSDITSYTSHVL